MQCVVHYDNKHQLSALPSLRKGATQHMNNSNNKVPQVHIMEMTSHIHAPWTHYTDICDHDYHLTMKGVTVQDNAGHVLLLNHTN